MPGGDSASRTRGRIERRGDALRVRVYAGDDPVTGKRVYRSETVPGTDRAAQRRAEKTLTRLLAEVDRQRAPTSTPVSAASMNLARPLGPALVLGDWTSWWAYLLGPVAGAAIAVGIAYVLRGASGGRSGIAAAQGGVGVSWRPGHRARV